MSRSSVGKAVLISLMEAAEDSDLFSVSTPIGLSELFIKYWPCSLHILAGLLLCVFFFTQPGSKGWELGIQFQFQLMGFNFALCLYRYSHLWIPFWIQRLFDCFFGGAFIILGL